MLPRKILVILQFTVSIILTAAAVVVYQQINSIRNRPTGYNPDNLVLLRSNSEMQQQFEVIRDELIKTGKVAAVTRTFSPITDVWWRSPAPDWKGKPADQEMIFSAMSVGTDFTRTMGVHILAGHDFTGAPIDSSGILLNKTAVDLMGLQPDEVIGMQLKCGRTFTVTGVTDDIVMASPFKPVDPMMTFFDPANTYSIAIRLKDAVQPQDALASIEPVFNRYNPRTPFDYQFADSAFNEKFMHEELIRQLSNLFTSLALLICVLGLAGLVAYSVETRIREISVRRVLGASVPHILQLLSKEFVGLLGLALLIAIPIAWWALQNWLNSYSFHINIQPVLFLIIGFALLLLTIGVVYLSTFRRLLQNPVTTLRSE